MGLFFWEPSTHIINTDIVQIKWYGVLFALGIYAGRVIGFYMYKAEGKFDPKLDIQILIVVFGTAIGSRFGHDFFMNLNL